MACRGGPMWPPWVGEIPNRTSPRPGRPHRAAPTRGLTGHLERVPDIKEQRVRRLPVLGVELEADAGADGADGRVVAGAQADAVFDLGQPDGPPVGPDVA